MSSEKDESGMAKAADMMSIGVEASHVDNAHAPISSSKALAADNAASADAEHHLTARQAIRDYPWALFWAFAVSLCVIMEGYDQILVGSLYAYPTFQKHYGTISGYDANNNPKYQLSASWQAGLSNGSTVGAFFGTLLNGSVHGNSGLPVPPYSTVPSNIM